MIFSNCIGKDNRCLCDCLFSHFIYSLRISYINTMNFIIALLTFSKFLQTSTTTPFLSQPHVPVFVTIHWVWLELLPGPQGKRTDFAFPSSHHLSVACHLRVDSLSTSPIHSWIWKPAALCRFIQSISGALSFWVHRSVPRRHCLATVLFDIWLLRRLLPPVGCSSGGTLRVGRVCGQSLSAQEGVWRENRNKPHNCFVYTSVNGLQSIIFLVLYST